MFQPLQFAGRMRRVLAATALIFALQVSTSSLSAAAEPCGRPVQTSDGWSVAVGAESGADDVRLCALSAWLQENPRIHGVVIVRAGRLVFEAYGAGRDQPWGKPQAIYAYDRATLHDVRSISKSVVSLLIGIAIDRKQVANIDDPVLKYLPRYTDLGGSDAAKVSIRDLLTMSSGFVANEQVDYADPNNSERLMAESPDPYRFALMRKMIAEPGAQWRYDGGSTMLLSAVVAQVSGKSIDEYAREVLFGPLGIENFEWIKLRKNGEIAAYGSLRLTPRDTAKIGQLVLDGGRWNGRQIVSESWIRASTLPRYDGWYPNRYGFQWWIGESAVADGNPVEWIAGIGLGGQRLFIAPGRNLVVAITAGLFGVPRQDELALEVFEDHVLPSLNR